jgi:hypothetical protein
LAYALLFSKAARNDARRDREEGSVRYAKRVVRSVWTLAIAMALGMGTPRAADVNVRFEVPEPFRVGGHDYDRGVISVHSLMAYNPTTSLLEVRVNGECIGMVTAWRDASEVPPVHTEAMFQRNDEGRLVMVGYRVTGRPTGTTFRFQEPAISAATLGAL